MTKLQLIGMEIKRIRKLNKISDSFIDREKKDGIQIAMNTFRDYMKARNENEEAFDEVLNGISLEGHVVHFKWCLDNGLSDTCTCTPNRTTMTQEIF